MLRQIEVGGNLHDIGKIGVREEVLNKQGRLTAGQFPHATFAVVADAGHTPDGTPCGSTMIRQFIATLRTDPQRCRHAGTPLP